MLIHTTSLSHYPLLRRGKVRDVYSTPNSLLLVATDRISAFDVVMSDAIPNKGEMLTAISTFWLARLANIVPNHFITQSLDDLDQLTPEERSMLTGRTMVVKKATPFPIECVVRGYLAGSGLKEYAAGGTVCGIPLPTGLQESSRLPEPIFTPATKAETGHDENISFSAASNILGAEIATRLRDLSIRLYLEGSEYAMSRGLILADTKFEFGLDDDGNIMLIDEVLTPDSSRYWLSSEYSVGRTQHNFDKQVLRDYLEQIGWNKQPPPPTLPSDVVAATHDRYRTALVTLTGSDLE